MSKGSHRRTCLVTKAREDLNWKIAMGEISKREYEHQMKKLKVIEEELNHGN